jgi:hypothetical protein
MDGASRIAKRGINRPSSRPCPYRQDAIIRVRASRLFECDELSASHGSDSVPVAGDAEMPTRQAIFLVAPMIARIAQRRKPKMDQRLGSSGSSAVKCTVRSIEIAELDYCDASKGARRGGDQRVRRNPATFVTPTVSVPGGKSMS